MTIFGEYKKREVRFERNKKRKVKKEVTFVDSSHTRTSETEVYNASIRTRVTGMKGPA